MEPEGSLLSSGELATGPYSEPHDYEYSPQPHILFKIRLILFPHFLSLLKCSIGTPVRSSYFVISKKCETLGRLKCTFSLNFLAKKYGLEWHRERFYHIAIK
jgi:hypothetical protein